MKRAEKTWRSQERNREVLRDENERGRQQVEGKWVGKTDRGTGNRRGAVETAKKGV